MADEKTAVLPEGTDKVIEGASGGVVTADTNLVEDNDVPSRNEAEGGLTERIRQGRESLSTQAGEKARGLVTQGLERSAEARGKDTKQKKNNPPTQPLRPRKHHNSLP